MSTNHVRLLRQIEEVSKNARTIWYGLVGAFVFSTLALAGVQDSDFFTHGIETTLPVVGVSVPTVPFFWAAPLLVLSIYAYLHLYLEKLWHTLNKLPSEITVNEETIKAEDAVYPWLISDAALYLKPNAERRFLSGLKLVISLILVWLSGPLVLLLFWVRSWPYHHEWLSLAIAAQMLGAIWLGAGTFFHMVNLMSQSGFFKFLSNMIVGSYSGVKIAVYAAFVGPLIFIVNWNLTEGPIIGVKLVPLYSANLNRANLVDRPSNWLPRTEAENAFLARYAKISRTDLDKILKVERAGSSLSDTNEFKWLNTARVAFDKERSALLQSLDKLDLRNADLRRANMRGAFLPGAQLQGALLADAQLDSAVLEGVDLTGAILAGSECAALFRVSPLGLRTQGFINDDGSDYGCTSLWKTNLSGANLRNVNGTGINASFANFKGASFFGADLSWSRLSRANLSRAVFVKSVLRGVDFSGANFSNASLMHHWEGGEADEEPTILIDANLQFTDFTNAKINKIVATNADFSGANLSGADISLSGLTAALVEGATGNSRTVHSKHDNSIKLLSCYSFNYEDFDALVAWASDRSVDLIKRFNLCPNNTNP